MKENASVEGVVDEIYEAIQATPRRQRRLYSSTFWSKFGFKTRTLERIEQVSAALRDKSLLVDVGEQVFGKEEPKTWVIISYVELPPTPSDDWFTSMAHHEFESEREVESFFVLPLLEKLEYVEDDIALAHPVKTREGTKRITAQVDCAVFNGLPHAKENTLLIVEEKWAAREQWDDAVGQARSYALWLRPAYYVVTDGYAVRVYWCQVEDASDKVVLELRREELGARWNELCIVLARKQVVARKQARRKAALTGN